MFTTLATDVASAVERLRVIQSVAARAKRYQHEIFADRSIAIRDVAPPVLISAAARLFTGLGLERVIPPVYNLIVSSVRGSLVDLCVVGARIEAIYPLGPLLMGAALNVTALSNRDGMDLGFLATPEADPDPWELVEHLEAELATLAAAAHAEP